MALTASAPPSNWRARHRGRGDRPAHSAPPRPRHDPQSSVAKHEPLCIASERVGPRRGQHQPRSASIRTGLRPQTLTRPSCGKWRRRADALLKAPGGEHVSARAGGVSRTLHHVVGRDPAQACSPGPRQATDDARTYPSRPRQATGSKRERRTPQGTGPGSDPEAGLEHEIGQASRSARS